MAEGEVEELHKEENASYALKERKKCNHACNSQAARVNARGRLESRDFVGEIMRLAKERTTFPPLGIFFRAFNSFAVPP